MLGRPDQELILHLEMLGEQLAVLIGQIYTEVLLTHPYEGSHPDHDALALATRLARRKTHSLSDTPALVEMTSYHLGPEGLLSGEFIPANVPTRKLRLSAREQEFKQRLFECFVTQSHVLNYFRTDVECFR